MLQKPQDINLDLAERAEKAETEAKHYRNFIKLLVADCELGMAVGSNIGIVWLKEQCELALNYKSPPERGNKCSEKS